MANGLGGGKARLQALKQQQIQSLTTSNGVKLETTVFTPTHERQQQIASHWHSKNVLQNIHNQLNLPNHLPLPSPSNEEKNIEEVYTPPPLKKFKLDDKETISLDIPKTASTSTSSSGSHQLQFPINNAV